MPTEHPWQELRVLPFYSDEGRVMHKFMCDLCGKELEHHGERYMVRVEQVPAYRECHKCVWDLCPECADRLREELDKGKDGKCDK